MKKGPLPYELMVFVCTNARPEGQRISCAGQGRSGEHLLKRLKNYVKEHGLEDRVRVAKSGCLEKCEWGPNVVAFPGGEFLSGLNESDLDEVISSFFSSLLPSSA